MDIEIFIGIEKLLRLYINIDIVNIILQFLDFENKYNQLIDKHIINHNKISKEISIEIKQSYHIIDNIETELFYILDHLDHWYHPIVIDRIYNYSPQIDFQFKVHYENWVWEIDGDIDPGIQIDYY